ncbi:MAG: gfo/Idh/MocA family oxidoreductase [Acidobacteria bacterium]|nr:MAG: gfo/Idh/MocA family oxidoreductase [Acidobacteriota bacterium]REK04321.1 MAG: gfo/Idh/MocA family oxidoreductase [Acidobacteriota bacterium]
MPPEAPDHAPLRTAVVGTGALGRHHVRLLSQLAGSRLVGIHDVDEQRARALAEEHGTNAFGELAPLLDEAEAVVVAVPTRSHLEVGLQALERGCHVMMEKPIAADADEARQLIDAAAEADRLLAVGHVEFFNPAVQELLRRGVRPRFVEVQRLSTFTPRSLDVDVVLDLMIHDLQIVAALDPSEVRDLRAVGMDVLTPHIDICDVRMELASGCIVKLTASRISDTRVRSLRVFGQSSYYSIDYQAQSLKGFRLAPAGDGEQAEAPTVLGDRAIVPIAAELERVEPLHRELSCFLARCAGDLEAPWVGAEDGLAALRRALEIVELSRGRGAASGGAS